VKITARALDHELPSEDDLVKYDKHYIKKILGNNLNSYRNQEEEIRLSMTSSKVKALISKQSQDKDDEFKKSKTLLADKLGLGKLNAS